MEAFFKSVFDSVNGKYIILLLTSIEVVEVIFQGSVVPQVRHALKQLLCHQPPEVTSTK